MEEDTGTSPLSFTDFLEKMKDPAAANLVRTVKRWEVVPGLSANNNAGMTSPRTRSIRYHPRCGAASSRTLRSDTVKARPQQKTILHVCRYDGCGTEGHRGGASRHFVCNLQSQCPAS